MNNQLKSIQSTSRKLKGPAQPEPGAPPPNLGHNGNGATNSNGNVRTGANQPIIQNVAEDGIGPAQPAPGAPPPNLGHNGNGARNSRGNLRTR